MIELARPLNNSLGNFSADMRAEMLGMREPVTFQARIYSGETGTFRSAAAHSLEAQYFNGVPNWSAISDVQLVHRDWLVKNTLNPRRYTSRERMLNLLNSIASQGVHTPLDISRHPEVGHAYVLSGHRRLWAIEQCGFELLPCRLDPRGILSEIEMREALIRYNEGQEKPAPIDRAKSLFELMKAGDFSKKEIAARSNISISTIVNLFSLLILPEDVQELTNTGKLQVALAYEIVRHPGGPRAQSDLAKKAISENMSVDQVKRLVQHVRSTHMLSPDRHNKSRPKEKWIDRVRKVDIKIAGPSPITLTVSSHNAELTPPQIRHALHEAIMSFPIELPIHHLQNIHADIPQHNGNGAENGAVAHQPQATSSIAQVLNNPTPPEASQNSGAGNAIPENLKNGAANSVQAEYLGGNPDWTRADTVQLVSRACLVPHPLNPRKLVNQKVMEDTLQSIATVGVHTPFSISQFPGDPSKAYIVGGHRRLWCATKLKIDLVPCRLDPRGVLSDVQIREALFRDNEGQEKPAPIDRAKSFRDYLKASKYSVAEAARRLGINEPLITRLMQLLELPEPVQELLNQGQLNESVGAAIREYTGGTQGQIALAHKAVARNLSAAQIRKFIGNQKVDLSTLAIGNTKSDGASGTWSVGGNLRMLVELRSEKAGPAAMTPSEILAGLQAGLTQVLRDEGLEVSEVIEAEVEERPAPDVKPKEEKYVAISTLAAKNPQAFEASAKRYLGSIKEQLGALSISESHAQLLQRKMSNGDMKRLKITELETTAVRAAKWHKMTDLRDPILVTLAQVFEWNAAAEQWLRALPPTKKQLRSEEASSFPLDIEMGRGMIDRAAASKQVQQRLKAIAAFVGKEGEYIAQATDLAAGYQSLNSTEKDNPEFTVAELNAAGMKIHGSLRWFISRWKRNVLLMNSVQGTAEKFNFSELHGYFTYALKELLLLTGGQTIARVGRKEVSQRLIAYSANTAGGPASGYSAQSIYIELRNNLETVAQLYQQRRGMQFR